MLLLAAALPLLALGGCTSVGYVTQAARGHLALMRARQPIPRLLESPSTAPALRERLEEVVRIREFASRELGLPDNASYRSYADLRRPYVVWNVVATPELSVRPRQWCFPVAGCVAYRGYFSEPAARAFAARLAAQGDDVGVFGVAAYSTLGRFADPVLNTMTAYGRLELAGLIFHELAHQRLYVPGDSAFNEAFATVVEEAGLERWAAVAATPAELAAWRARRQRAAELNAMLGEARETLRELYGGAAPVEEKRRRKREVLDTLGHRILEFEERTGRRTGLHEEAAQGGLTNAHLAAVATYRERVPVFEALLREEGGDLRAFYEAAAELARELHPPRGPARRHVGPR